MKAKFVNEISFKRGIDSRKSLNIGKYKEIMHPDAEDWLEQSSGLFILQSDRDTWSVVRWDRDKEEFLMNQYSWQKGKDKETTLNNSIDPYNITRGRDPFHFPALLYHPEGDGHWISIVSIQRIEPEDLGMKESLGFEGCIIESSMGVGGYSADQCERDTRDILKKEYGNMDIEERDIQKFLKQYIEPAFESDDIYDNDSLYDFILQGQK